MEENTAVYVYVQARASTEYWLDHTEKSRWRFTCFFQPVSVFYNNNYFYVVCTTLHMDFFESSSFHSLAVGTLF